MGYGISVHADMHVAVRSFHVHGGQRIIERFWKLIEKSLLLGGEGFDITDGLVGKV